MSPISKTRLTALLIASMMLVSSFATTALAADPEPDAAPTQTQGEEEKPAQKPKAFVAATTGREEIPTWKAANSDVRGWLKIPDTNINHAVVVGPDNMYYMEKGYDKQYSRNGVVWADSRATFGKRDKLKKNTVLYGHNWTNFAQPLRIKNPSDVMFGQLPSYHYLEFAQTHPYIYFSTEEEDMTWQVFSVFYTEEEFNYILANPNEESYKIILDEAKKRSLHDFGLEVTTKDKILTLSTCTRVYGKRADQRYVVMAKLLPADQKLTSVDVKPNPNFKTPQLKAMY